MNRRIRINGKLYEAVDPYQLSSDTSDDTAAVRRLAKYADQVDVVNKKSADTIFDVAIKLLSLLASKGVGYNRTYISNEIKRLQKNA